MSIADLLILLIALFALGFAVYLAYASAIPRGFKILVYVLCMAVGIVLILRFFGIDIRSVMHQRV